LGTADWLVMDAPKPSSREGKLMANDDESLLASPPTQEVATHVADYAKFIKLLKWGALVSFVVGLVWMLLIKAYW
jgi:hypothetical protein